MYMYTFMYFKYIYVSSYIFYAYVFMYVNKNVFLFSRHIYVDKSVHLLHNMDFCIYTIYINISAFIWCKLEVFYSCMHMVLCTYIRIQVYSYISI